jgi:signal transduction histidine kinase/ActR/RegA family two-component response regulator
MGRAVLDLDAAVFQTERAAAAFEKYAAVAHLTVCLYGRDERLVAGPIHSTPLFELFTKGREPPIFGDCLRRCLAEAEASAVIVQDGHGLAVVGAPFTSAGEVVCVAVAGYVVTSYLDQREMQRLSRDRGLSFQDVQGMVRRLLPIPTQRLPLYGELLRIIGDTLLSDHRRSRQLEEALARLEAADQSKDEFLAVLSHELRTPLTSILGWTRMLRAGSLDAAMSARGLEAIERNAKTQTRLINDLLDVSRIVSAKLELDRQRVDLVPLIDAALDAVRVAARAKDIRLEAALDPSIGPVSGDPERLGQIVSNLLSNAVKFTGVGGRVTVGLDRVASEAKITVTDTGPGISPHVLPHIFERFRQADSTPRRAHRGLGLGLAIVRHLVELHGGTVRADSAGEGEGATFTVMLPLLDLPLVEPRAEPAPSRQTRAPALQGLRVLVVEDDNDTREVLKTVLERSGAQVTVVASADEALKRLDEFSPEVLVCDIGMPGTDGYTLMRQVRARGAEHGGRIPAVAVTGFAAREDRERAVSAGYQLHLAKPVEPSELARAVATLRGRDI